jgi:hypothetical protein
MRDERLSETTDNFRVSDDGTLQCGETSVILLDGENQQILFLTTSVGRSGQRAGAGGLIGCKGEMVFVSTSL